MELWSDDADHGPSPAQRVTRSPVIINDSVSCRFQGYSLDEHVLGSKVQQRGLLGTGEILDSIMEGVDIPREDGLIFCVDLMPNTPLGAN